MLSEGLSHFQLELIEAVRSLRSLRGLVLELGDFTDVEAAAVHLTRLQLSDCGASCSHGCMCVTSLIQLQVSRSELDLFHEGVAACTCLKHLELEDALVGAVDAAETFTTEYDTFCVPSSLTALTELTWLSFT